MARLRDLFSRGANVLMFARAAPFYARYTLRFHLPAEVLLGCFAGVIRLADLLSRKTLLAPKWMIACQSSAPAVALLLAMVWRDLLDRSDRRRVLLLSGVLGKGVLFLVALITSPGPFLVLIVVWSLADSAFLPLRNSIFRANYAREVRGRMFGGVVSLTNLALVAANLLAAHLMDRWDWSYRVLFPAAAALGLAGHVVYARVRVRGDTLPPAPADRLRLLPRAAGSLARAFRQTVRILRKDRAYRAYERNFFIYGLGFLMNLPLVVLLVNDRLDLPYEQASLAWLAAPRS